MYGCSMCSFSDIEAPTKDYSHRDLSNLEYKATGNKGGNSGYVGSVRDERQPR
jgi:hypothetical protein